MADVSVELEALRSDAVIWDEAASSLDRPKLAIEPLGLTPNDVMSYAASRGLDRMYNETRVTLQDMICQAAENFRRIADTLREAADMYERAEDQHELDVKSAGEN